MEFSTKQQIKVGIFVFTGLLAAALSIMFLGEDQFFLKGTYTLRVKLRQVSGLNRGSQVLLSGFHVGNVQRLEFAPDSQDLIALLKIDRLYYSRLTEGTQASIKTLGALGDKYIYLTPGQQEGRPLENNSFIPSDGGEDFIDMIAKKGSELSNVVDVVRELNILLKNINHDGRSAQLMENLAQSSTQLKYLLSQTREGFDPKKINEMITHVNSIVGKIDRGEGSLGALINDPSFHQNLMAWMGDSPRKKFLKPLIRETISTPSSSSASPSSQPSQK